MAVNCLAWVLRSLQEQPVLSTLSHLSSPHLFLFKFAKWLIYVYFLLYFLRIDFSFSLSILSLFPFHYLSPPTHHHLWSPPFHFSIFQLIYYLSSLLLFFFTFKSFLAYANFVLTNLVLVLLSFHISQLIFLFT